MPRERLLLLAPTTTYRADDFLRAAQALSVEVLLATDRCHVLAQDFSEEATGSLAVELRPPERAVEALCALHAQRPFVAIVPVDDATTVVAAEVAARLGLRCSPPEAVHAARDKALLRARLLAAQVPQPRYRLLAATASASEVVAAAHAVGLPCVLKPTILSASQGVMRADDEPGVRAAYERLLAILRRPEVLHPRGLTKADTAALLCESFVPGPEVALEGLLRDGQLTVLALFDKPDPLDGPFFEETIYVTPSRLPAPVQDAIARTTAAAAAALGLRDGPLHAELRLPQPLSPVVIEVAARSIGGLCSRTLRFCTGRSLEELILLSALGRPLPRLELLREETAAGVMMLPIPQAGVLRAVHGVTEAAAVPGIEAVTVTARLGDELVPLPEGGNYLGFVFARAATPAQVEASLRAAHACLHFDILKVLPTA